MLKNKSERGAGPDQGRYPRGGQKLDVTESLSREVQEVRRKPRSLLVDRDGERQV